MQLCLHKTPSSSHPYTNPTSPFFNPLSRNQVKAMSTQGGHTGSTKSTFKIEKHEPMVLKERERSTMSYNQVSREPKEKETYKIPKHAPMVIKERPRGLLSEKSRIEQLIKTVFEKQAIDLDKFWATWMAMRT